MDQALSELHEILNGVSPRTIGGILSDKPSSSDEAQEEVSSLGPNPSSAQTTLLLMTQLKKMQTDMKNCNKVIAHHLMETLATVKQQGEDIARLEEGMKGNSNRLNKVEDDQKNLDRRMKELEQKAERNNEILTNNRQREAKGNFIFSGDHLPPYQQNENLFNIFTNSLWQKYGLWIQWDEVKTLHRLSFLKNARK